MTKKIAEKIEICFGKGRKHCGKWRKCWLPAFSTFPAMFLKDFSSGLLMVKIVWKGLTKLFLYDTG